MPFNISVLTKKIRKMLFYMRSGIYPLPLYEQFYKQYVGHFDRIHYQKLIKGLDDESIQTVCSILGKIVFYNVAISGSGTKVEPGTSVGIWLRIKIFLINIGGWVNRNYRYSMLSQDDIRTVRDLQANLHGSIVTIAPDCFAYKKYFLPIKVFSVSVFGFKQGLNELQHIEKVAKGDIIDVGGYIGDSAIVFSDYTDCVVHSFEPVRENYNLMLKTVQMNERDNIKCHGFALGERDGDVEINSCGSISSIISNDYAPNSAKESIRIRTLDGFVAENDIKVSLIKVDVEGFEQSFLRGALKTIQSQKPTLMLSIYHNPNDFFNIKPMIEELDLGYKFKIRRAVDGGILEETLLIAEVSD